MMTSVRDRTEEREARNARCRDRRAKGLCTRCGVPATPGRAACEPCRVKSLAYHDKAKRHRRLAARKRAGQCFRCESPALPGYTVCETHRDAFRASNAKAYRRNPGKEKKRQRERLARQLAEGICYVCGKPGATLDLVYRC